MRISMLKVKLLLLMLSSVPLSLKRFESDIGRHLARFRIRFKTSDENYATSSAGHSSSCRLYNGNNYYHEVEECYGGSKSYVMYTEDVSAA